MFTCMFPQLFAQSTRLCPTKCMFDAHTILYGKDTTEYCSIKMLNFFISPVIIFLFGDCDHQLSFKGKIKHLWRQSYTCITQLQLTVQMTEKTYYSNVSSQMPWQLKFMTGWCNWDIELFLVQSPYKVW